MSSGISEEQQGFRKNRSAIDAIFVIFQIKEKAIEFNKTAYMCFIDLTQAFDRVRLSNVTILLKRKKIHPKIIKVIEDLNTDNYTYVRMENKVSSRITVTASIRQGDLVQHRNG
ncbi:uncharacterized protein LOC130904270 [Diorhabda carinulata]|uniref:uncharacterized protein LOC130904270 n=1 Tax=Diorhabda carinulata TaxID=1163345 RepID=UPI0025A30ECA|nr:uncharacterized protein LOC130904270 [Diorhabda carinulata]